MYKALMSFTDLQDNSFKYQSGDIFPRDGLEVSEKRLEELSTAKNRRGKPVIEKVEEKIKEEPVKKEEKSAPAKKSTSGRKKTDAK